MESMVHAAAVFFPVTDMHQLGKIERLADGGPPESAEIFWQPENTAAGRCSFELSPLSTSALISVRHW